MRGDLTQTSDWMLKMILRNSKTLDQQMMARRRVLWATPDLVPEARKIASCTEQRRCNHECCPRCGVPSRRHKLKTPKKVLYQEPPTADELMPEPKCKNFRARGGQILCATFNHFDPSTVFTVTIHLKMVPWGDDVEAAFKDAKRLMRNALNRKCFRGRVFQGFIEDKQFKVGNVRDKGFFRTWNWARGMEDEDIVTNLHIHGAIHVPGATKEDILQKFRQCGYDGPNQVFIDQVTPRVVEKGRAKGGLQGWGEYCAKRFIDGKPAKDNPEVYREVRRTRKKLTRKSVQFGVGIRKYRELGPTWKCEAPPSLDDFIEEMIADQRATETLPIHKPIYNYHSSKALEKKDFYWQIRTNVTKRPKRRISVEPWIFRRETEPIRS